MFGLFCPFALSFNFPSNPTRCRLGDLYLIFHDKAFKIKYKLYISSGSARHPQRKILAAPTAMTNVDTKLSFV